MRAFAPIAVLILLVPLAPAADKLTFEDRVELTRGLMAEYGTVKVLLPRSKKPLEFNSDGTYDKRAWSLIARESGPAARHGDQIEITKLTIESDRLILEINGGFKGGRKWYQGVQIQGPMSGRPTTVGNGDSNAPGGTSIAVLFHKPLEAIKSTDVKKMLAPILDFDKHTVTELYADTLSPAVKQAITDKRVTEGMTREQVILSLGHPVYKSRETKDGLETEDWVYGAAPGKITFVTFEGDKVIKVKVDYAGLGTQVSDPGKI
ncbi:MAG TPA: hypothetical protein VME43_02535 [Bryobacteraceae bacterium]|nr:hypothetical protein [Bryobacteraceae bacterium]